MSQNYYHKLWTLTSHRRLKNIIVILEWIPNMSECQVVSATEIPGDEARPLTSEQEMRMRRSFDMFNHSRNGVINLARTQRYAHEHSTCPFTTKLNSTNT